MKWVNLAVIPHFSWPNVSVQMQFEGRLIVLQPLTDELSCTVSVFEDRGLSFEVGGSILCHYLSCLAWSMEGGIVELFITGSNNLKKPGRLGRGTYGQAGHTQSKPWEFLYLPQPVSEEAKLSLALFREGLSVNSVPFAFLSYFKILNIRFKSGEESKWINDNLGMIKHKPILDRLNDLIKSQSDIGQYLYIQGRCAVAHANGPPIVNPDKYEDKRRLELDLPLIREVASIFIEKELGVLTDSSYWKHIRNSEGNLPELLKRIDLADGRITYMPIIGKDFIHNPHGI